jgi:signal transduction histidine kinase
MKLRSSLAVLVLAGVIPLIVITAIVTIRLVHQQRAAVDEGLADTVAALATAVENEIQVSIKSLETLATSQALDGDDLPAFYQQATRVRRLHDWSTIGLIDSRGNHRLNVARPLGASLPDLRDREYFKQVVATGRPYVSDLIKGRATATVDIGMAVPVVRDGRLKHVLFAGVDPARFSAVFEAQKLPPLAIASIVSRDGLLVARSRDHAGTVGRSLPAAYLTAIRGTPRGRVQRVTVDGIDLESAYTRMALTGWTVDLGLPADVVSGPVRRIAWLGAIAGGGIIVAVLGLALVFARRMARDIKFLAAATSTLGRGVPAPAPAPLKVAEFEEMRRFVADADEALRERDRQRAELLTREQAARADAEHMARVLRQVQLVAEAPLREASADRLMRALLASVRAALGTDTATILLVTEDGHHLSPVSSDGLREEIVEDTRVPLGRGVAGRIASSEAGMIFADLAEVEVLSPFLRDRVKSLMGAPLRVGNRLIGVIHVGASSPHQFTDDDQLLLNLVADRVALVIELARLHETERAARAQAEMANEGKDQFLAMLSHELRTPLTSIVGWVRMLRTRGDEPAIVAQATDVIERNATLQARLINDLLDVSRIIAGKLQLDRRPVDLGDVARAAIEMVRPAAEGKRVSVAVMLEAVAAVDGDAARLQQIVGNLLSNAIKFTPENGRVTLRVDRTESDAVMTVTDTGAGISADFLPHVFDAFRQAVTAPTRRASSGLGLGLAIVQHLVKVHGGTVTAESAGDGLGSTFTLRLPLHDRDARD